MKYYLYPLDQPTFHCRWDYDYFFGNRWIQEAYEALCHHPARTTKPEEADYFIISDTLACVSFNQSTHQIVHRVNNADTTVFPYWNGGNRHVVFDLTDFPQAQFVNKQLHVFKSAFNQENYRAGFDVSIPQFPRYHFDLKEGQKGYEERPITLSFRGHPRRCPMRSIIFSKNNDYDYVYKSCANVFEFEIKDNQMVALPTEDPHSYPNLLKNSKYSLLIKGTGYALSYRKIEAMNCGSVPLIMSDGYVLPFSEILDYSKFSVTLPEAMVEQINSKLEEIPKEKWRLMHNEVLKVYEEHFASTEKIIQTTLGILASYN